MGRLQFKVPTLNDRLCANASKCSLVVLVHNPLDSLR